MSIVQIIVASTRQNRVGGSIGRWADEQARRHGSFEVELIDLRDIALPLFDEPRHPRFGEYEHDHTKHWSETVRRADAFVFVTPEYNHSFPASLKNAIDYLNAEWKFKPAGFVSYGGVAAGTRAVTALEPVLNCFQMKPLMEAVNIPFVSSLIDDEKRFNPPDGLVKAMEIMLGRLEYWIARQSPLYER